MSDFAVQSYCFRGFKTNQQVIDAVKQIGLAAVELCAVHVDFNDPATFDNVIGRYRNAGIDIVSIGVQVGSTDEAVLRNNFDFAVCAGCQVMSIAFPSNTTDANYRLMQKLSSEYNVPSALHNHGGRDWQGSADAVQRLFDRTNDRIGLCLDTAWALDAHEDPIAMADRFAQRLYSVHVKDFIFDRAGKPKDVVVGTGNLDLPAFFTTLKKHNFRGPVILEYEGDIDNPVPALTDCVAAMRQLSA